MLYNIYSIYIYIRYVVVREYRADLHLNNADGVSNRFNSQGNENEYFVPRASHMVDRNSYNQNWTF